MAQTGTIDSAYPMDERHDGAVGDRQWKCEIERETVRMVTEREKHTLAANLIGWLGCCIAANFLPDPAIMALPLLARLLAITSTRVGCQLLRAKLRKGQDFSANLRAAQFSISLSGVTWALLLWPLFPLLGDNPFANTILGVVVVGASLVGGFLGPLPRFLLSYTAAFLITLLVGIGLQPGPVPLAALLAAGCISMGMTAYSLGSAREARAMAGALVENRRLGIELTEALHHAEFLSKRDPLTGLLNRRAFFEQIDDTREGPAAGQKRHLLTFDLDHFKRVNDNFGHATGDRVLIAVADRIRALRDLFPRQLTSAVRTGGEEFLVLLDGMETALALQCAEALRHDIASIAADMDVTGLVTSASFGLVRVRPEESIDEAAIRADRALYEAKHGGRDQVIVAEAA